MKVAAIEQAQIPEDHLKTRSEFSTSKPRNFGQKPEVYIHEMG
jgi:hypothetical protein